MSHICESFIDSLKILLCSYIYWLSFLHNNNKIQLCVLFLISFFIYFSKYIYILYHNCNYNNNNNINIWLQFESINLLFLSCCILSTIIYYNDIIFSTYLLYIILIGISYIINKKLCVIDDNNLEQNNLENNNLQDNNLQYSDYLENNLNLDLDIDLENNHSILNNNDIICIICLEEFNNIDDILQLKCNHYYHKLCIYKWIDNNSNKTCPICKYKIIQ